MPDPKAPGAGRETRLLLLVIVVAVAMLLILAQFRYPAPDRAAAAPVAGPIERLAARATFEELALIMSDVSARVLPGLTSLQIERMPPAGPPQRRGATPPAPEPSERRFVAALRVDTDLAVAYLPEGFRVAAVGGDAVVEDDTRRLVLVRVDAMPFTSVGTVASLGGSGYLAVFEGARGGPAVRPLFLGRVDEFEDPRWPAPVLAVGGDPQLSAGAFLYALDGRLVGMTIPDESGVAIVRVPALLAAVEALRIR